MGLNILLLIICVILALLLFVKRKPAAPIVTSATPTESSNDQESRLLQQQLVTEILYNFNGAGNVDALIDESLLLTSMVVNCDCITVSLIDQEQRSLSVQNYWRKQPSPDASKVYQNVLILPGNALYENFIARYLTYFISDSRQNTDYARQFGAASVLVVPLKIRDELVGILQFDRISDTSEWEPNIISVANAIGNIIAGVIARKSLTASLMKMSAVVEKSPSVIAFIDQNYQLNYFNPALSQISGYHPEEIKTQQFKRLCDQKTICRMRDEILPKTLTEDIITTDVEIIRADGKRRILYLLIFKVQDGNEAGTGFIASDVTEQRKLERELVEAKDTAERANQAKSNFLSNMSHEMRTPMNAILGMTRIALRSSDPAAMRDSLNKIDTSSRHLLELINNILDMSKIEADKLALSNDYFSLEALLDDIYTIVSVRAHEKNQRLIVQRQGDIPEYYFGDALRISQIATNLINNAIKFSDNDTEIKFKIQALQTEGDRVTLQFEITDHGIGMDENQIDRLFNPFEQADSGIARKYGGTGLGLPLSKKLVELFGGEIRVRSKQGVGSVFTFTVNLQISDAPSELCEHPHEPAELDWTGKRILLVDDVEINREIVISMLEDTHLTIDCAENGLIATEMVRQNPDAYHLILMDVQMPVMDGYEATDQIKKIQPDIPIVAMTANAFVEDIRISKSHGMVNHITKPIEESKLIQIISRNLR